MKAHWSAVFLLALILTACASSPMTLGPAPKANATCALKLPDPLPNAATEALDLFSDFLEARCFKEAIQLGAGIRQAYRQMP